MHIYKIHNKLDWSLDGGWLILSMVPFILPLFIYFKTGSCDSIIWAITIGIMAVFPLISLSLFSRWSYFFLNKNDKLIFYENKNSFVFYHNKEIVNFMEADIKQVLLYTGIMNSNTSFIRLPWEDYTHIIIKLKNGKSLILSSLIFPESNIQVFRSEISTYKSVYRTAIGLKHSL